MQFAPAAFYARNLSPFIGRIALVLCVFLLSGSLLACSSGTTERAQAGNTPIDHDTPSFVVFNDSAEDTICKVFFSPTTNENWEANRLGLFSSLESGQVESFEVDPGNYDIRMEDCDHNLLYEELDIAVEEAQEIHYTGRGSLDSVLTISNDSRQDICWVYFSPTNSDIWGGDQLGVDQILEPRQTRTFQVASDTYDVLLVDCNENTIMEEYEIDIAGEHTISYTE
jgi:hypothetical protein